MTTHGNDQESPTGTIWRAFSSKLRSFIRQRISDPSDVDDILQEVFLKIHLHIDELEDRDKIISWVYQVARNTIIDTYRKQKPRHEDIDALQLADEQPEESPAQEIASGLREMVDELPEKYAEALRLVEFEGLPQQTLAQKLGISTSGAKSRVQRGRQMLKDTLMRCCHFQFDRFGTIIDIHPHSCCCCKPPVR